MRERGHDSNSWANEQTFLLILSDALPLELRILSPLGAAHGSESIWDRTSQICRRTKWTHRSGIQSFQDGACRPLTHKSTCLGDHT